MRRNIYFDERGETVLAQVLGLCGDKNISGAIAEALRLYRAILAKQDFEVLAALGAEIEPGVLISRKKGGKLVIAPDN